MVQLLTPLPYLLLFWLITFSITLNAGQFTAGFARVDITPELGETFNYIEGGKGVISQIHGTLQVNSLVLSDGVIQLALVSVESIDLTQNNFDQLRATLKREGIDHAIIAVTHTHGGMFTHAQMNALQTEILTSVRLASQSMQPVSIGATRVTVDEAYNRRKIIDNGIEMVWTNPTKEANRAVDQQLEIIHLRDATNAPFVTLFNYAAHPVVTMDLHTIIVHPDYPGDLVHEYENQNQSGKPMGNAMFFMGASGDVNPYHANTTPIAKGLIQSKAMAKRLLFAANNAPSTQSIFHHSGNFNVTNLAFTEPAAEVTVLALTPDIALASFPGEYFDALGTQLKAESPYAHTLFIGKSNGDLRYVPTEYDVELGGFGADTKHLRVKPTTGKDHITEAISALKAMAQAAK